VNNAGILDERVWEKMIEVNTVSGLKSEERRDDRRGPSQARPVLFSAEGNLSSAPAFLIAGPSEQARSLQFTCS